MQHNITVTQVSSHGASNPIVARLFYQMSQLFNFTNIDENQKKEIMDDLYGLLQSLLGCFDIKEDIVKACDKSVQTIDEKTSQSNNVFYCPHIENLEMMTENFLYQAKKYLRNLAYFFKRFYSELTQKKLLFNPYSKENLFDFLLRQDATFQQIFEFDKRWIGELISKRNAVEHPGDKSGILKINNFEVRGETVTAPLWCRESQNKDVVHETSIVQDISKIVEYLLDFSEEVIINYCIKNNLLMKNLAIYVIPVEERDPNNPMRFGIRLI